MKLLKLDDFLNTDNKNKGEFEKSNFRFAFYLLKKEKRIAISNFYLLCSYLDNIVDNNDDSTIEKLKRINYWKNIITEIYDGKNILLLPLTEVFQKYSIPKKLLDTLIDGISLDLENNRYNTFEELLEYCYGVASVVGLICMYIFTNNNLNENLEEYAINLGYALQLTNIIRDVGEDFKRNYIYIPQELLIQFNYHEENIANHTYNDNFYELMNYLYEKIIYYYSKANYYLQDENKDILKSAEVMKNIYFKLLLNIKKNNFHIYEKKIKISGLKKIWCAINF